MDFTDWSVFYPSYSLSEQQMVNNCSYSVFILKANLGILGVLLVLHPNFINLVLRGEGVLGLAEEGYART